MKPRAPLLQACPETNLTGHNRTPGQQVGGWPPRICPECTRLFEPNRANQIFCTKEHNADWNNRATARGRVLTPYSMVAAITRNGSRGTPERRAAGKAASRSHHRLIQRWRNEDRAAGRMEWPDYLALRIQLGFDPE